MLFLLNSDSVSNQTPFKQKEKKTDVITTSPFLFSPGSETRSPPLSSLSLRSEGRSLVDTSDFYPNFAPLVQIQIRSNLAELAQSHLHPASLFQIDSDKI